MVTGNGSHRIPDQSYEPIRAAKLVNDFQQPIMANSVKGLGQVHKGHVEAEILFRTLLMQLSCSKHHVNSSTALLKAILTLQQQALLKVLCQMVQQDPGPDFPCNGKQRDASLWLTQTCLFPFHSYR